MATIKTANNADAITLTQKQLNKLHEGLGTDGEDAITANDLMRLI